MSTDRPALDDWRRQGQERFLSNVMLIRRKYYPSHTGWDHDHCEFCGEKFSVDEYDLNEGYSTVDGYHWICDQCYTDFKAEFNWKIDDRR